MSKINNEEVTREELLSAEDDILAGVLGAVESKENDYETIVIKRGDKVFFKFGVRGFSEDEIRQIRERNSIYRKNNMGVKVLDEFKDVRFTSEIIYKATIDKDREKIWDNPQIKNKLGCLTGLDVIEKVLMAGEKDAIYSRIQRMSGFGKEDEIVETLKN